MDKYWNKLAYERTDISACVSENIRYIGAVQGHSELIVINKKTLKVIAISEGLNELYGESFLNTHIDSVEHLKKANLPEHLTNIKSEHYYKYETKLLSHNLVMTNIEISFDEKNYFVSLSETLTNTENKSIKTSQDIRTILSDAHIDPNDLQAHLNNAVSQIKEISGYDRILIYRFEPNYDGYVIAEKKNHELHSFLGLRYPESDIPKQARKLFFESNSRVLIDVDEMPKKIITQKGLAQSEVNLSKAYYRASSPFHVQYLKNMGVKATCNLPIKVNGKLWGLIACHNYKEKKVLTVEERINLELIGGFISSKINSTIEFQRVKTKNYILSLSNAILDSITKGSSISESFQKHGKELMSITDSSGLVFKIADEVVSVGEIPNQEVIDSIVKLLATKRNLTVWSTKKTENVGIEYHKNSVGVLAVPLSLEFKDYIIWFRPAANQTIRWAGYGEDMERDLDASTGKLKSKDKRLDPRGSFNEWQQKISDCSLDWTQSQLETAQEMLFSFVRDIFKQADELSKANKKLLEISKSKDEFISMVSHELRTPLNAIIGWVNILKMSEQSESTKEAIEVIDRNANIQVNLIDDLLDISRIIAGKMRISFENNVNLKEIIKGVIEDLSPTAQSLGITFQTELEEIFSSCDPERFRQIIWNILSNAIKYNKKHGFIDIKLFKIASTYTLIVKDNGIGIDKEHLPFIFDRFKQAGRDFKRSDGIGLGLSIVKSLVELHGGKVQVESAGKDLGSTFTVTLPIYAVNLQEEKLSEEAKETIIHQLSGLDILLLEDQDDASKAMKIILESLGARVTLEKNGKSGFASFAAQDPGHFDLILSDIGMPEWDGLQFIKSVRRLEKDRRVAKTPAIAITAYASPKDRVRSLKAGFQTHIPKPIDVDELVTVITGLLER